MTNEQLKAEVKNIILESFKSCRIGDNFKANERQITTWLITRGLSNGLDLIPECLEELKNEKWFDSDGNYCGESKSA